MKKNILGVFLFLSLVTYAQESFIGKDDVRAYVGANFQREATGISVGVDYGFGESISLGVQAGYLLSYQMKGNTTAKFGDRIDIRGRFNTHLGRVLNLPTRMDVFSGLDLSLKNFGAHIGARYFFQRGIGIYSEFGFPIARYNKNINNYDHLNNQFHFQLGVAFDMN